MNIELQNKNSAEISRIFILTKFSLSDIHRKEILPVLYNLISASSTKDLARLWVQYFRSEEEKLLFSAVIVNPFLQSIYLIIIIITCRLLVQLALRFRCQYIQNFHTTFIFYIISYKLKFPTVQKLSSYCLSTQFDSYATSITLFLFCFRCTD